MTEPKDMAAEIHKFVWDYARTDSWPIVGDDMFFAEQLAEHLRRSVLSEGVLVPRDLAQGLLQCAEEATWMGGVYHIHSATMVTELRALLSAVASSRAGDQRGR